MKKAEYGRVTHASLPPFYDENSEILILGSMPSVATRKSGFYYAHPQNRFFKTLALLFEEKEPISIEERKAFLKKHHIALYDVIYSCDIIGSSDASIKNAVPCSFDEILKNSKVKKVFTAGKRAYTLYREYVSEDVILLPSTSPANAAKNQEQLVEEFKVILEYLK